MDTATFLDITSDINHVLINSASKVWHKSNAGSLGLEPSDLFQEGMAAIWSFWCKYRNHYDSKAMNSLLVKIHRDGMYDVIRHSLRRQPYFVIDSTNPEPVRVASLTSHYIGNREWEILQDIMGVVTPLEAEALKALLLPLTKEESKLVDEVRYNGRTDQQKAIFLVSLRLKLSMKRSKEVVRKLYELIKSYESMSEKRYSSKGIRTVGALALNNKGPEPKESSIMAKNAAVAVFEDFDPLAGLEVAAPVRKKPAPAPTKKSIPAAPVKGKAVKTVAAPTPAKGKAAVATKTAAKPVAKASGSEPRTRMASNATYKATPAGLEAKGVSGAVCKAAGTLVKGASIETIVAKLQQQGWEPAHKSQVWVDNPRGYISGYVSDAVKKGMLVVVA